MYKQVTIVGTGLIGGSLALALKRARLAKKVVGCDRAAVLATARRMRAIDAGHADCGRALSGSELIVLATPVGQVLDFLDRFGPVLPKGAFVTDVGSTKAAIVARARQVFGRAAAQRFLGGHPMAGRERGGIEHADAALFAGATWFLTPLDDEGLDRDAAARWAETVAALGARVMSITPERHDQLVAWTSHLPQMAATALAAALADFAERFAAASADDLDIHEAGGRALREMTRVAASPYSVWRDIALTNTANIEAALLRLEQELAHVRENLRTRALQQEFARAQRQAPARAAKRGKKK